MKKSFLYSITCLGILSLFSCNTTSEDVARLNSQREMLDSEITSKQTLLQKLNEKNEYLNAQNLEIANKVQLQEAEVGGNKIADILGLKVSIRRGLEFTTANASFEIPVSKEFYESATIGQELKDVSGSRAFSLSIHSAGCQIQSKRIIIAE